MSELISKPQFLCAKAEPNLWPRIKSNTRINVYVEQEQNPVLLDLMVPFQLPLRLHISACYFDQERRSYRTDETNGPSVKYHRTQNPCITDTFEQSSPSAPHSHTHLSSRWLRRQGTTEKMGPCRTRLIRECRRASSPKDRPEWNWRTRKCGRIRWPNLR